MAMLLQLLLLQLLHHPGANSCKVGLEASPSTMASSTSTFEFTQGVFSSLKMTILSIFEPHSFSSLHHEGACPEGCSSPPASSCRKDRLCVVAAAVAAVASQAMLQPLLAPDLTLGRCISEGSSTAIEIESRVSCKLYGAEYRYYMKIFSTAALFVDLQSMRPSKSI